MEHPGINQRSEGPNPQTNQRLVQGGGIFHHLPQRGRYKPGNDQPHTLLDPNPNERGRTGQVEPENLPTQRGDQQDQSKEIQEILTLKLGWPSIRDDAYSKVPEWQQEHFDAVKKALKKGVFRENITWWPLYKKYVNLAFSDIVFKGADVLSTLDKYKLLLEKENFSGESQ